MTVEPRPVKCAVCRQPKCINHGVLAHGKLVCTSCAIVIIEKFRQAHPIETHQLMTREIKCNSALN